MFLECDQGLDQRARSSVRAEPYVDSVKRPGRRAGSQRFEHALGDFGDELLVGDRCGTARGGTGGLVEKDQVQIAVIVELAATKFAQCENGPTIAPARR